MQKRRMLLFVLGLLLTFLVVACTPDATQYKVTFNSHGGPSVASQTVDKDGLVTEPSITRDGYTLDGWFKESTYDTKWIFTTNKVTSDMTLHAKWTENAQTTYTITFNTDGGQAVANQTRTAGQTFGSLPEPTKANHTFAGWFLDQNKTQAVVPSGLVTSNVTLYAKWNIIIESFTVTFDAGPGADVEPGTRQVASGTKVLAPNTDYPNYELIGWFKEAGFVNEWDFDVDVVTSSITLYAKWELIPEGLAIHTPDEFYNLVNGTSTYEAGQKFYLRNNLDFTNFNWDGTKFNETDIAPHTFNLNGNGKTISNLSFVSAGQAGIIPRMAGGSVFGLTLDNVHVEGTSQGGILVGRVMNSSTVTFSEITIKNSSVKGASAGVGGLIGHIQGAAGLSTVLVEKVAMLNVEINSIQNGVGGLVGDVESSKLTINDALVDVVIHTTGERIGGLVGEARRNSGTQTLPEVIVDRAVIYTNLNGSRYFGGVFGRTDNNLHNLEVATHGSESKQLPGSISNVIVIGNYNGTNTSPASYGHLVYAKDIGYSAITNAYAVAFNFNVASLGAVNVLEANNLSEVEDLPIQAFEGFTSYWKTEAGKLPEFSNGTAITLGHKVTIQLNETESQVQYVRNNQEISDIYFASELGQFIKWTSDVSGATELSQISQATNAYPQFKDVFVVTFNTNGGATIPVQNVLDGEKVIMPSEPTRFGYLFKGWYTDEALTIVFDAETLITSNLTLYASWEAVVLEEFEVTFETNGGNSIATQTVLEGALLQLPQLPTKDGFIFDGWFIDIELNTQFVSSNPITQDLTLYAKWVEDQGGEVPTGIAVQTAQEFYDMATGSNGASLLETYYLANDIDFTGFTWVGVSSTFSGELNGNGKTLSNLTYNVDQTTVFNGLFHNLNGAKVHNFEIENFNFTSSVATTRSAFIAGQVQGTDASIIENILIRNSSISAEQYVAAIVGRATGTNAQVHISNIKLDGVTIKGHYVAGIIADLDAGSSGSTVSDIQAKVTISGRESTNTTERMGGIVGRARSTTASTISRVYMDITSTTDKWGAGIAGDAAVNALVINDVFVTGSITTTTNSGPGIVGNGFANAVVTNAFVYQFTGTGTGGLRGTLVETKPDQAWWNTNLTSFTQSLLWNFNETTGMYELVLFNTGNEVVNPESFTVSFDTDNAGTIADQSVLSGQMATMPTNPTKEGFTFVGWFASLEATTPFNFATPIANDLTLYAKWEAASSFEGFIAITTAEEFKTAVSASNVDKKFYVANDLDFTGVTWIQSGGGSNFGGYLDGNNKTLSNITITSEGSGVRGGIFQKASGATIKNMIIDNTNITISNGRAGILIGGSDTSGVGATVDNITILNSNVSGTVNEGTGIVLGHSAGGTWSFTNIRIDNTHATTSVKNTGLLIGRVDGLVTIENIYISNSSATSAGTSTDSGVGGLVGYLNLETASLDIDTVLLDNVRLAGRGAGFIVGYNNKSAAITVDNMYAFVTYEYSGTDGQHGMIGRRSSTGSNQVVTNVFAYMVDAQLTGAEQLDASNILSSEYTNADFQTNLPVIFNNQLFASHFIA
ncbi:InlB B-repeat-containing protein [Acholeplasma granularum]|uniref:InlB B-repeat-containing protein n=1 Tax=Acholeplasma granularum TaxID=264635 RepID=UPI00046FACD7|nr:InlB B-repeat-containing protein [Acholeplasma granularum]